AALASADRLLSSKKVPQRLAGLELLRLLVEKKKAVPECRERAKAYQQQHAELSEGEDLHIEVILDLQREKPSLKKSPGVMDPQARTKPVEPVARKVVLCTAATMGCLKALDDLIHEHRETPIKVHHYGEEEEELLGNLNWGFPDTNPRK